MFLQSNLGRGRSVVAATMLALVAGAFPASVSAGTPAPPGECATVMPKNMIETGMVGRGWTVARGDTPERFRVQVLGILPDAIAPGKDLIIIEASDVNGSSIIADAGGIWSGMSGSPVYVNGQLIGAVAYGLSGSTSPVGGVTPAADMLKVLDYGSSAPSAATERSTIVLPADVRQLVAEHAGVAPTQARALGRLPVPLAVSGLTARALNDFQQRMDDRGVPVVVVRGSRASRPTGASEFTTPVPGGNFAAVISYGDISAAGIGTTTYVCDEQALAFGHPMSWTGPSALGANDANAIRVISDPIYGSYKLATLGDPFGMVDQDRMSAIRAALGETPAIVPVTSSVTDVATGNTHEGRSGVTINEYVPIVSANQLLFGIDPTIDRLGGGSSRVRWTVTGHRANGSPWSFERVNRYADSSDISFASVDELYGQLSQIESNPFGDVTFDSVDIVATVESAVRMSTIQSVMISKNGGTYRERDQMQVKPGDRLSMRVRLRQYRGDLVTQTLSMIVPVGASGYGYLQISGGGSFFDECFWYPEECDAGSSFSALLTSLENAPKNHDLLADLEFYGNDFDDPIATEQAKRRLDRVVMGSVDISLYTDFGNP